MFIAVALCIALFTTRRSNYTQEYQHVPQVKDNNFRPYKDFFIHIAFVIIFVDYIALLENYHRLILK